MNLALIKLAAMGDVALACRALKSFASQLTDEGVRLHWIVDETLMPLARALLDHPPSLSGVEIVWHPVDAARLFRGSGADRAREAFNMLRIIARAQPRALLLLHRDWRYRALLRPVFTGPLIGLTRERIHELDVYTIALERLARATGLRRTESPPAISLVTAPKGKVGMLVGGAQNQKVTFREKRWPLLPALVELMLKHTEKTIYLFGGPDDRGLLDAFPAAILNDSRVVDCVGRMALHELPSALADLDAFVSIDSGPAHVASAVMTAKHQRVITLFGPTDPRIWGPRASGHASAALMYKAKACSPCYANDGVFAPCRYEGPYFQHCMTDISAEEVFRALSEHPV